MQSYSCFCFDVDRASYANIRRYLSEDELPPPDAVRVEEMVNYFTYHEKLSVEAAQVAVKN